MYREYGQWWSPSLGRTMEFLWFGQFGRPVMMFPTSSGRFFENEDFGLTGALALSSDPGRDGAPLDLAALELRTDEALVVRIL